MSSIADSLAAEGHPVTLADGTTAHLQYTFAALRQLESTFGNVARILQVVQDAANRLDASFAVAQGTATPEQRELDASPGGHSVFGVLVDVLGPGLLDVQVTHPRTGQTVWLGEHPDAVERLLSPGRLQEYLDAFGKAFNEAFDDGTEAAPAQAGGGANPPARASRSRGASGGTSRSGAAGTAQKRSGA